MKVEISPSDKSLLDLTSKIYDQKQLSDIVAFNGSMNELNAQYPIECLRKDRGTYRVSYLGNRSVAILLFDNSGKRLSGKIYSTSLLKSDFDGLEQGQLLKEVTTLDPCGEYLFLYTGRNDVPKVSFHYTTDGYKVTIEYTTSNTIKCVNAELI